MQYRGAGCPHTGDWLQCAHFMRFTWVQFFTVGIAEGFTSRFIYLTLTAIHTFKTITGVWWYDMCRMGKTRIIAVLPIMQSCSLRETIVYFIIHSPSQCSTGGQGALTQLTGCNVQTSWGSHGFSSSQLGLQKASPVGSYIWHLLPFTHSKPLQGSAPGD